MPIPDRSVWLDAQGAQNAVHFDRGIPRYVSQQLHAVMELARDCIHTVGLNAAQPLTANLHSQLGTGLAKLRTTREAPPYPLPAVYHVMSPFELDRSLDELWPDWARVPDVATVVTLYDLIPLVFSDQYLRDPIIRARFEARANLVRGADHVLAISQGTAGDATGLLGVPPRRITVVDAGVAIAFQGHTGNARDARTTVARQLPTLREGFMLYVAGIEFRKNLERLIEAYGLMAPELRRRHQLVLTCKVLREERAHLQRVVAEAGLARNEVIITGYVTDAELAALYRLARLFVFASFYEGSGLPILEAMACDVPIAASNTSTSPEILGDLEATFDPHDPADMARVLSETVVDDALLGRLRERSRARVRGYTWERVARRTIEGYDKALANRRRRAGVPRRRPRIAVLTPWPPEQSGIASYNTRLVPALARHVDVDVIVRDGVDTRKAPRTPGVRLLEYESHERWARALRVYDRVLYCMGNSAFHGWIYEAQRQRPGVLVAHDVRLTGFYGWYSGQERIDDPHSRLADRIWMQYGHRLDVERWRTAAPTAEEQEALGLYMTHEVQENAHAVIVHSRYAADILRLDRPPGRRVEPPIHVIPHAMPWTGTDFRRPRRDAPLTVSFGVLSYIKGLDTLIHAFAIVASRHPTVRLVLAGHGDPAEVRRWRDLARELGVGDRVEVTGYVTAERYEELLAEAAVSVQLRLTSNGEASGAVANNLASGLPTIVTDIGWFSELPDDAVVKVPVGVGAGVLARRIDEVIVGDAGETLAEAGRRHAEEVSFASVARRYVEALLPSPAGETIPEPLRAVRRQGGLTARQASRAAVRA